MSDVLTDLYSSTTFEQIVSAIRTFFAARLPNDNNLLLVIEMIAKRERNGFLENTEAGKQVIGFVNQQQFAKKNLHDTGVKKRKGLFAPFLCGTASDVAGPGNTQFSARTLNKPLVQAKGGDSVSSSAQVNGAAAAMTPRAQANPQNMIDVAALQAFCDANPVVYVSAPNPTNVAFYNLATSSAPENCVAIYSELLTILLATAQKFRLPDGHFLHDYWRFAMTVPNYVSPTYVENAGGNICRRLARRGIHKPEDVTAAMEYIIVKIDKAFTDIAVQHTSQLQATSVNLDNNDDLFAEMTKRFAELKFYKERSARLESKLLEQGEVIQGLFRASM